MATNDSEKAPLRRLVAIDLFSGAGGAGMGYLRSGFEVVPVDIEPHANPTAAVVVADALEYMADLLVRARAGALPDVKLVHASCPCQRFSTATARKDNHPDLITPLRPMLQEWAELTGGVYIMENVPGAPLVDPVRICGSSFPRLGVRRHRLFESNISLRGTTCDHKRQGQPVGCYGSHPDSREFLRPDGTRRGARARSLQEAQAAMGIDWMNWKDLVEAIPPAYTEHLGRQVIAHLAGQ